MENLERVKGDKNKTLYRSSSELEEGRLSGQSAPKMSTSMGTSPSLLMMGPRPGACGISPSREEDMVWRQLQNLPPPLTSVLKTWVLSNGEQSGPRCHPQPLSRVKYATPGVVYKYEK